MGRRKSISVIFTAAVFIILEMAALAMLRSNGVLQRMWISKGVHAVSAEVWGRMESIRDYFSLRKANDELANDNFVLSLELNRYREMTGTDLSGTVAGQADTAGGFRYVPATIVKMGNNSQHNYMIIGKGSEEGIVEDAGIITSKGALGIVDAVSRHYSYVISFWNSGISVSARIGRQGPVGPLSWDGRSSAGAILSEIPHHIEIEKGDTVFTSGYSSIFPPDIPLGVTGEWQVVNGATYRIRVHLFEDSAMLRYVTVVSNSGRKELEELENR